MSLTFYMIFLSVIIEKETLEEYDVRMKLVKVENNKEESNESRQSTKSSVRDGSEYSRHPAVQ